MEPLKRQQRKVDNEYTIMFIPHRGKEPKSFSFRASLLKKIGIFCGILLLAGIGIAAKSSMVVYQAHQEQNELIAYRNDKAAQDQKLAELQKENEKMQKDMAELSALENEVRKALGSNVSQQPSRGGIDRSQYMGKGGPSAPADIKMIDVTAAQAKNLQTEMQQKKAVLGDLLAQLHERNAKLDATPDICLRPAVKLLPASAAEPTRSAAPATITIPALISATTTVRRFTQAQPVMWNTQAGTAVTAVM